ncbi:unnamed protein product, partial [Porites lobata]
KLGPKAPEWLRKSHGKSKPQGGYGRGNERGGKGATKEGIAGLCERIRTRCATATIEREDQRKSWYTSTCSEYVQKEYVGTWKSRSAEILLKDLHHNGDAFVEDHMGLRCLEQSEEDPLVYQTGHRQLKCIIGKVQIIKDGNNFSLSCLEEQRLVALLQGTIESDDSPASGGDEEEGEQAQADNFSEPIRFEAGRSRSGRPTTRYVL